MIRQLHIVPSEGEWAVRDTNNKETLLTAHTQAEAISEATDQAVEEEIDIVVHRRDGTFRNVIASETLQKRAEEQSKICGLGPKTFWSVLAAGAVGGLAAYLILNPPARLEPVRRDLEDHLHNLKKRFA